MDVEKKGGKWKSQAIVKSSTPQFFFLNGNNIDANGKSTFYKYVSSLSHNSWWLSASVDRSVGRLGSVFAHTQHLVSHTWFGLKHADQKNSYEGKRNRKRVSIIEKHSLCEPHNMMILAECILYHVIWSWLIASDRTEVTPFLLFSKHTYTHTHLDEENRFRLETSTFLYEHTRYNLAQSKYQNVLEGWLLIFTQQMV